MIAVSLCVSGCAMKKSSPVEETESDSQIYDGSDEMQGIAKYKSLIDKYVGEAGMPYRSYGEILKWDDYHDTVACMCPAEEWLDSEGKFRLPFDYADIRSAGTVTSAYFYVPDELSVKVSTGELADVSLLYASRCILLSFYDIEYYGFEFMVKNCNALEESLRRDDFAGEYLEKYMTESESMPNAETVPEYYEGMNAEALSLYFTAFRQSYMLDMSEVVLAQPEAYAQLTDEQRAELVKRVIERFSLGEQGKLCISSNEYNSLFFACVTGKCYLSGDSAYIPFDKGEAPWRINPYVKGEIQWQDNPWIDAINEMDFTEDEQRVTDKYFNADK